LEEARKKAESMLSASQIRAIFDDPANPNPFSDKNVLELHIIRPSGNLPTAGLEFRPFLMAQMMEMVREAAENVLTSRKV
jgi:hypothetical protein